MRLGQDIQPSGHSTQSLAESLRRRAVLILMRIYQSCVAIRAIPR
ncbi:hypothetical protein [Haematospirillum jordaniae]|nr:hypothetical protein [Haematospirillum jordaniae]